jgi:hypothetical protein
MTKDRLLNGSSIMQSTDEVYILIESNPYFTTAGALRARLIENASCKAMW